MSRCVEKIELVFENCESLVLPIKRIGKFIIDDIHKGINRSTVNSINEWDTADTVFMQIFNRNRTKKLYRICNFQDITAIYLTFDDNDEKCYYVDYDEPEELEGQIGAPNENQSTYITDKGDILLTIAKGKTWNDFMSLDEKLDKKDVYYNLLNVDESDDIEGNLFSEIEEPNKKQIKKDALAYVIKDIEELLGTLDFDIMESQGAMIDLDTRFEQVNIFKDVLKYLDPNYEFDFQKLNEEAYKRYLEKAKDKEEDNERYLKQYLYKYGLKDLRDEGKHLKDD